MKLAAAIALTCSLAWAQDATALLAQAHAALIENQKREAHWNWTTTTTRSVINGRQKVLDALPSVTIESPIRSDGKRCNAVLAWGDGRKPYLANASADQRCQVEEEVKDLLPFAALLEPRPVKLTAQTQASIALSLRENKELMNSSDPVKRCAASVEAEIQLDPVTFFPELIEIRAPNHGCNQPLPWAEDHYTGSPVPNVNNGFEKGSSLRYEYELQKDKTGDHEKDFWICVRSRVVRPMARETGGLIVSGRTFPLASSGADRQLVVVSSTTAKELSAESVLKFDPPK